MTEPSQRRVILSAEAMNELQQAKQQIIEAAIGKVPERLVLVTATAAVRLRRREAAAKILPKRIRRLVRNTLKALAQHKWKPDTALLLRHGRGERRHGLSQ